LALFRLSKSQTVGRKDLQTAGELEGAKARLNLIADNKKPRKTRLFQNAQSFLCIFWRLFSLSKSPMDFFDKLKSASALFFY